MWGDVAVVSSDHLNCLCAQIACVKAKPQAGKGNKM
ncbi:MAG: hypothetical protein ACJAVT_001758 [Yoonia sp.]|jgi:hypothetical protein